MKLTATKRATETKSDLKKLRRAGNIPAILYAVKHKNEPITIEGSAFAAILRELKPGHLPTMKFTLALDGQEIEALIKEIQYERTTYRVSHIDFERLGKTNQITAKVPLLLTGLADCVGIKLGGFLRQIKRHIEVTCLPQDLPANFVIDVRDLGIKQSKRIRDIALPKGVTPIASLDEVVAVVAKRAGS